MARAARRMVPPLLATVSARWVKKLPCAETLRLHAGDGRLDRGKHPSPQRESRVGHEIAAVRLDPRDRRCGVVGPGGGDGRVSLPIGELHDRGQQLLGCSSRVPEHGVEDSPRDHRVPPSRHFEHCAPPPGRSHPVPGRGRRRPIPPTPRPRRRRRIPGRYRSWASVPPCRRRRNPRARSRPAEASERPAVA